MKFDNICSKHKFKIFLSLCSGLVIYLQGCNQIAQRPTTMSNSPTENANFTLVCSSFPNKNLGASLSWNTNTVVINGNTYAQVPFDPPNGSWKCTASECGSSAPTIGNNVAYCFFDYALTGIGPNSGTTSSAIGKNFPLITPVGQSIVSSTLTENLGCDAELNVTARCYTYLQPSTPVIIDAECSCITI